MTIIRMLYS